MHHCNKDWYDMCDKCYKEEQKKPEFVNAKAQCPKGHRLKHTTQEQMYKADPNYEEGFICDNCDKEYDSGNIYRCDKDNWGMCEECYQKAINKQHGADSDEDDEKAEMLDDDNKPIVNPKHQQGEELQIETDEEDWENIKKRRLQAKRRRRQRGLYNKQRDRIHILHKKQNKKK